APRIGLTSSALRSLPPIRHPPRPALFPYTTLFRSRREGGAGSPRRVSRRQRLYFTPRSAARRRGGNSRAVDTRLTVSPMLVEARSEEHTSELQSRFDRVCRLLLEKKNKCPRAPG